MTKTILFSAILISLLSCQPNEVHTSQDVLSKSNVGLINTNKEFSELYDRIPEIQLPFNIVCGINPSEKSKVGGYSNIPGFIAIGKVYMNNGLKIKSIIGYYQSEIRYPYLFTFDEVGNKIDSIAIHNGNCATDPWIQESCWAVVNPDNEIIMTDTTKYYFFADTIRRLDSVVILREKVTIDMRAGTLSKKTMDE